MASGRLGAANVAAITITDVYTVPASTLTSCNINICNRNTTEAKIRIAISDTSVTQGTDEFIEYDTSVPGNGVLERTALLLDAGKILTVYSDVSNISAVVMGVEEAI